MTYEQRVKELWPQAEMEYRPNYKRYQFNVTIKPGMFAWGSTRFMAWRNAYEAIVQDGELAKGEK